MTMVGCKVPFVGQADLDAQAENDRGGSRPSSRFTSRPYGLTGPSMPGVSTSELGIVLFILVLIVVSARLPRMGESLGSYFYRRSESQKGGSKGGRRNDKNASS